MRFRNLCSLLVLSGSLIAPTVVSAEVLVNDQFNTDGPIVGLLPDPGPGVAWEFNSMNGNDNPIQVSGGQVVLVQNSVVSSQDIKNEFLTPRSETDTTYAGFDFILPAALNSDLGVNLDVSGLYFANFRGATGSQNRGRTGVVPPSSGGDFGFAINASSSDLGSGGIWPSDLSFDTTYRAVISYDAALGRSDLWINPTNELSPSVFSTGTTGTTATSFSLRQGGDYDGTNLIDNVIVATTFAEVLGSVAGVDGDYNGNGIVDAADYTIWRDTLTSTTDLTANGDDTGLSMGVIDQADYDYWEARFGNTSSLSAVASIPEPHTLFHLVPVLASLLVAFRR